MKIQGFRVRKYRNIEDSGYVNLLSSLTCIVGKNQSGKTALLKALYKFNPYRADPYDLRREWPRGQRTTRNSNQVVCEVNFKLEEEEKQTLAALTGQALTATEVTVSRNYEGRFEVRFPEQPDFFPDALHASNERAHDYIITRIPTFIYMDDYKRFRGNAHLDTVKQKLADTKTIPLTEEDETFLMILRLAGLDLDQLVAQGNSGRALPRFSRIAAGRIESGLHVSGKSSTLPRRISLHAHHPHDKKLRAHRRARGNLRPGA